MPIKTRPIAACDAALGLENKAAKGGYVSLKGAVTAT